MKAVILAGGEGTRLKCVTGDTPKPLVPLLGRSMMEHILRLLRRCGFTEVCAALRYRAADFEKAFSDGSSLGIRLCYRVEGKPLGTAGALGSVVHVTAMFGFALAGLVLREVRT